jgi:hypothetical protein
VEIRRIEVHKGILSEKLVRLPPQSKVRYIIKSHVYNPSYVGGTYEAGPEQNHEILSRKITKAKKGWWHGSNDRARFEQAGGSEYKPVPHIHTQSE